MRAKQDKKLGRAKRHDRIRRKLAGTAERPRLGVFRSNKHIYAQITDDQTGAVLAAASTLSKTVRAKVKRSSNIDAAKAVGAAIAELAKAKDIIKVVFDRGGYIYHGRVKALADAAREKGLIF